MAMIRCEKCGTEVSSQLMQCSSCNAPILNVPPALSQQVPAPQMTSSTPSTSGQTRPHIEGYDILGGLAVLLGLIGSVLHWVTISSPALSQSVSGVDSGRGVTTLLLGIVALVGLVAYYALRIDQVRFGLAKSLGLSVIGIIVALIAVVSMSDVSSLSSNFANNPFAQTLQYKISIGTGLYLVLIGGIATALAGGVSAWKMWRSVQRG